MAGSNRTGDPHSRDRFDDARRKALVGALLDLIRQQPNSLLSFEEVRRRLYVRGQRSLGLQVVPVDRIIGSEGRYADFDRHFLPRVRSMRQRWAGIYSAVKRLETLPPIELYKIGDVYFVRDGNHRVSVAREQGQTHIDAHVTELVTDVPLGPELSVHDLLLKEEYSDFLEWTGLHDLRPDERIEFSEPGGYLDLIRDINVHRYYMGEELQRAIGREEAVADWYDTVYQPLVRAIHAQGILRHFPGRTDADLYRWIADHRWAMVQQSGADPGPESAVRDYMTRHGHRNPLAALRSALDEAFDRATAALRRTP